MAAGIGAAEGAIAGVGAGEDAASRTVGGLVGAGAGGVLGGAAPAAVGAIKSGVNRVRSTVSDKAARDIADIKALQAIEEANMTPRKSSAA